MRNLAGLVLVGMLFAACGDSGSADGMGEQDKTPADSLLAEAVGLKVYMLPAPLQAAAALNSTGVEYRDDILLDEKETETGFLTSYQKAVNLGIYGIDMGYATMYNQNQKALHYLSTVKDISQELDLTTGFTGEMIKSFKENKDNRDSLCSIILHGFDRSHDQITQSKRDDIGLAVIAGSLIEGLYISSSIALDHPKPDVVNVVGMHKLYLISLMDLLSNYSGNSEIGLLLKELGRVKKLYNPIKVDIGDKGMAKDVMMSYDQIKAINKEVKAIRSNYVI